MKRGGGREDVLSSRVCTRELSCLRKKKSLERRGTGFASGVAARVASQAPRKPIENNRRRLAAPQPPVAGAARRGEGRLAV